MNLIKKLHIIFTLTVIGKDFFFAIKHRLFKFKKYIFALKSCALKTIWLEIPFLNKPIGTDPPLSTLMKYTVNLLSTNYSGHLSLFRLPSISLGGQISISIIPLSRLFPYPQHLSISNISLSQTSLYLKHLHPKHLSISNISPSQTSLYLKHLSISIISPSQISFHLFNKAIPCSEMPYHMKNKLMFQYGSLLF